MCGIFGYTGPRDAAPLILEGLAALEYRGYDSAGISVAPLSDLSELPVVRAPGKLSALRALVEPDLPSGPWGMGHTRWATHGGPTEANAHPHRSRNGRVAVVQNGIVENYADLRDELTRSGFEFASETDAECVPHLIELYMSEGMDLAEAVRTAAGRLRGANAIVAMSMDEPGRLVALRLGHAGGLVIGMGEGETMVASDLAAIVPHTRSVSYMGGGEIAVITPEGATFTTLDGDPIDKAIARAPADQISAAKGSYKHFMLKEINEQPEAVVNTLRGRVSFDDGRVHLGELTISDDDLREINRVVLIGMGTSLHAAMVGRMWIEKLAKLPAEVDNSSEFRYRDPVIDEKTLVISICQSGETADTLAAMSEAESKGAKQITLSNHEGGQTTRIADATLQLRAGAEVGVAATKTFVCSLTALYLIALHLGRVRGVADDQLEAAAVAELAQLPRMFGEVLARQDRFAELAKKYAEYDDFLYLGRGLNYPLAMEGALKLKEISYIHAEGYPAGEMKHGPISLIDRRMPVVALMPSGELFEKMLSNVNEVGARGGHVLAITTDDAQSLNGAVDDIVTIPDSTSMLSPIVMALPMQLLAYHIGVRRGCDVDQPRNLAKSVTVE
jgi:glucosamine--fructose-6-phosphate aminotransferase (isomerizing)